MRIAVTWLRLEVRQRWRSLTVLALLVALATATVLAAAAGARRGQTAFSRLWARTLPATATVLPDQPGFNWAKIRAFPEVSALSMFPVTFGFAAGCCPGANAGFPPADGELTRTIERPVILQGRLLNPSRVDAVLVTPKFAAWYGKGVGDTLTLLLASPQQADAGYDGSTGPPRGPKVRARIVGVGRSVWESGTTDETGQTGGVLASPALFTHYRVNIMGTTGKTYINALVRLEGGAAAIPAFRAHLARVTGRSDIDVWNNLVDFGEPIRRVTEYEAACLLGFALAALVAAFFLVGQSVARYTASTVVDLQVLQAVGMTQRQAVASASAAPFLAAVAGATAGVTGAAVASRWMPIGAASIVEPHPGFDVDWLMLGAGWVIAPLLVLAGSAAVATALTSRQRQVAGRRSAVAAAAARAGLPAPVVVGARFAVKPGHGRSAVPVRPALVGAVAGVLGVLAAFTFSAGVSDAAANPARFGQTWQLGTFLGLNGRDFGPASRVLQAVAADRDVIGVDDARIAGAQSGQVSIESFTYDPVAGKRPPIVLTDGRMPATRNEIVLAPTTARELRAATGSTVRLTGGAAPRAMRVTGIGFVPPGPHNGYADGAWLTSAGYDRIFGGARYSFKFYAATVALRPGANVQAVARRLNAAAAAIKGGGQAFTFTPPAAPPEVQQIKELEVLPQALSAFLALLAIGAVGHALFIAVHRRRHELAVLRALGMTRLQTRMVVATQASVLAVIGLVFGVPLGVALGRTIWRVVAGFTPLAYQPPLAGWALLLIGPVAVLTANTLAAWPGQHAARLRTGQVLRTE